MGRWTRVGLAAAAVCGALLASASARAQVVYADVGKNLEYQQTSASTVVPYGAANAFLFGRTFYKSPGDYTDGTFTPASSGTSYAYNISGILDCCGHYGQGYQTPYMTQAAMDTAFPTGDQYTLAVTNSVTSASESLVVPFNNDMYATVTPQLDAASFNALSTAGAVNGLTVNFTGFTSDPNATTGLTFFTIYDYTAGTYAVNYADYAASTSSFTIDPGALTAGHSYVFELIFDNQVQTIDPLSGAQDGVARSDVRTLGYFAVPGPAPEPSAWALMLLGVAAMGGVLRGSRRASRAS